jgi:hypothetical protein
VQLLIIPPEFAAVIAGLAVFLTSVRVGGVNEIIGIKSITPMLIVVLEFPPEFVPVIEYAVVEESEVGVPVIWQLLLRKSPAGKLGLLVHEIIVSPVFVTFADIANPR